MEKARWAALPVRPLLSAKPSGRFLGVDPVSPSLLPSVMGGSFARDRWISKSVAENFTSRAKVYRELYRESSVTRENSLENRC